MPIPDNILQWLREGDTFASDNGIRLLDADANTAHAEMTVAKHHLNAGGVCQGGALFTLADLALAAVMNAEGKLTVSLQTNIVFHRPAVVGDQLTATATALHSHHRVPTYEIAIRNRQGTPIATLTAIAYRKDKTLPMP